MTKTTDVFDVGRFMRDINAYRTRFNLTLCDVGLACDINTNNLRNIIRRRSLSLHVAVKLARFADLDLNQYMIWDL